MDKEKIIPSSAQIVQEAEKDNPEADLNKIHSRTFELIKKYRHEYYKNKVDDLLSRKDLVDIPKDMRMKIEKELLKPSQIARLDHQSQTGGMFASLTSLA